MISNKNIKNNKKIIAIALCAFIGLSSIGCSKLTGGDSKTIETKNIIDVRTAKIINQQQTILKFTTENKAGSIHSIKLEPENGKYFYTMDAIAKTGENFLILVDGETGEITKKESKGMATADKKANLIGFVPVMDVDKAAKSAISASKNKFEQIISYKLFNSDKMNIYKFVLGDDIENLDEINSESESKDDKNAKVETIYVNADNGDILETEKVHEPTDDKFKEPAQDSSTEKSEDADSKK